MSEEYTIRPIGTLHCQEQFPYDAPRQGVLAGENRGVIELLPGYEQALTSLDTFSRIWLLFLFDRNHDWKPMVQPPRHSSRKVGVFASRAPYRPNRIGLSCVKLVSIKGLKVYITEHDLLDKTPILDIKPYLPYADSFPDASPGWTQNPDELLCNVQFSPLAEQQVAWLEQNGVPCIRQFLTDRLCADPVNPKRNRLVPPQNAPFCLAYRTWRADFALDTDSRIVTVLCIRTAYSSDELLPDSPDKYADKPIHRLFLHLFPSG
ncbi:MAG: tRNA (N6-threonylcarbamoyladenosine(37)-N6)-methyltransferase TrmO [Victivallales bacterium]|nr:tRNA (N6-threonylcarbamoyladenosine(37)-N6)-methyltransferase TrmO [Victivallales bacterium]